MIVSKKGKSGTELRLEGPVELLCAEATMILVALQDTSADELFADCNGRLKS